MNCHPRIIAAAVKLDGCYVSLPPPARHSDIINRLGATRHRDEVTSERFLIGPDGQGFLTSQGKFVSRELALQIAQVAEQLPRGSISPTQLFTEDLW